MSKLNSYYTDDLMPKSSHWTGSQLAQLNAVVTEVLSKPRYKAAVTATVTADDGNNDTDVSFTSPMEVDWDNVASRFTVGNQRKSAIECFMMYRNGTCPSINKSTEWSDIEVAQLTSLAEKYDGHEWSLIASKLGTNRTPMACLQYFQRNINIKKMTNATEFTAEEDRKLLAANAFYTYPNHLYASSCLRGRNRQQCNDRIRKLQPDDEVSAMESVYLKEEAVARQERLQRNSNAQYKKHLKEATTRSSTLTWTRREEKMLFLAALAYHMPQHGECRRSEEELSRLDSLDAGDLEGIRALVEGGGGGNIISGSNSVSGSVIVSANDNTNTSSVATPRSRGGRASISCSKTKKRRTNSSINNSYSSGQIESEGEESELEGEVTAGSSVYVTGASHNIDRSNNNNNNNNNSNRSPLPKRNWADVAALIPGRTDIQCREKWNNAMDPTLNLSLIYSPEEDAKLLKLLPVIGVGNWAKLAEWFDGRCDSQLLKRYRFLAARAAGSSSFFSATYSKIPSVSRDGGTTGGGEDSNGTGIDENSGDAAVVVGHLVTARGGRRKKY